VLNSVRTVRAQALADQFLGVRLTSEELSALDRFGKSQGLAHRSDAVRYLVKAAEKSPRATPELPVGLITQLDELVEDGWAKDLDGALTLVLTLGLAELSRLHTERLPALKRAARSGAEKRAERRRAEREGRGLLER